MVSAVVEVVAVGAEGVPRCGQAASLRGLDAREDAVLALHVEVDGVPRVRVAAVFQAEVVVGRLHLYVPSHGKVAAVQVFKAVAVHPALHFCVSDDDAVSLAVKAVVLGEGVLLDAVVVKVIGKDPCSAQPVVGPPHVKVAEVDGKVAHVVGIDAEAVLPERSVRDADRRRCLRAAVDRADGREEAFERRPVV